MTAATASLWSISIKLGNFALRLSLGRGRLLRAGGRPGARLPAGPGTTGLGETAENVADRCGITRGRQDEFALRSHQLAAAARDAGRFDAEIVPLRHLFHRVARYSPRSGALTPRDCPDNFCYLLDNC